MMLSSYNIDFNRHPFDRLIMEFRHQNRGTSKSRSRRQGAGSRSRSRRSFARHRRPPRRGKEGRGKFERWVHTEVLGEGMVRPVAQVGMQGEQGQQ